jgi:hypothetical protein
LDLPSFGLCFHDASEEQGSEMTTVTPEISLERFPEKHQMACYERSNSPLLASENNEISQSDREISLPKRVTFPLLLSSDRVKKKRKKGRNI